MNFDLNIDKVLENWEVYHAIREIIANALDETKITNSRPVEIFEEGEQWIIKDYGRGISIEDFTQNENEEKLNHESLIGRFGVGLKDALATFERNNIVVEIESKNGLFTLVRTSKNGFESIETLHVSVHDPSNSSFEGTEIKLKGCKEEDISRAKELFLDFSGRVPLEITEYGEIYLNRIGNAFIYISGVKVAEEDNFMFSYNITSLNSQIKKSLNRERTNVGRTAYSDRVKAILLKAQSSEVLERIAEGMNVYDTNEIKDELRWTDVGVHAIQVLNKSDLFVFMSQYDLMRLDADKKDIIESSGKRIVTISDKVLSKLSEVVDIEGSEINTYSHFFETYSKGYIYDFINPKSLSSKEQKMFEFKGEICRYFGLKKYADKIRISNTIRPTPNGDKVLGEYDFLNDHIIIRKDTLNNAETFFGVLIHELVHAKTGYLDVTREFEYALTEVIGMLAVSALYDEKKHRTISKTNSGVMKQLSKKLIKQIYK